MSVHDLTPENLPPGWALLQFDVLVTNVTDSARKLPTSEYQDAGKYPVIDQGEQGIGGYTDDESLVHTSPTPTIIFGDHTRCIKIVRSPFVQGADGVKVLLPTRLVSVAYAYWMLKAATIPSRGYARHFALLRKLAFRVAPKPEQTRIVHALDSYTSRLSETTTLLERVQRNLKRYRASVLKAAVEGRLVPTEAELASAEKRDYEPASALLERILVERRQRWERLGGRGRYSTSEAAESQQQTRLPEGWQWVSLASVAEIQLGQQRAPVHADADVQVPYVRAANITWAGLDLNDVKTMGFVDRERYSLEAGDVLLSEASGSPMEAGKPAIWRNEIPGACYQKTLLRIRSYNKQTLLPEFLRLVFLRDCLTGKFARLAPGVGIVHLTAERMHSWAVPLPPTEEQLRIVTEVDRLETAMVYTMDSVRQQERRCTRLRQAIFKWAFEGKLVDQDSTDEPASALLERIRNEREPKPSAAPRAPKKATHP